MLALLLCLQVTTTAAQQRDHTHEVGDDIVEVLRLSGVGFLHQFIHWEAAALWGTGAGATAITFIGDEDERQLGIEHANLVGSGGEAVGDVGGLLLGVGIVNAGFYVAGRLSDNERAIHFALELSAVQVIANLETLGISQLPLHERPVEARGEVLREEQPFFNVIRGRSSFSSGHVIGPAALAIKSWQFYGWRLGLPTSLAAAFVGYARIQEGQHYVSDVIGSYALTLVACWAVSSAANPFTLETAGGSLRVVPYAHGQGGGVRAVGWF